jgi:hypothetical protein
MRATAAAALLGLAALAQGSSASSLPFQPQRRHTFYGEKPVKGRSGEGSARAKSTRKVTGPTTGGMWPQEHYDVGNR